MKKLCLLLAFCAHYALAQQGEWITVGPFPPAVPALTKQQSNATPNWRGWTKPIYDDVNRGLLIYLASPNCCGGVYVNSMFLYNVESNSWKLMFSHTTSRHSTQQLIVGLSRTNNVVSATLASPEEWPADPSLHSYLGFGSCKASDGTRTPLLDPSFATTVPTRVTLNIPSPGDNATGVTQFSFPQSHTNTTLSCPTSIQSGVANCGCAWGLLDSDDTPTDGHPYHQMTWDSTRHVLYRAFGSADAYFAGTGLWAGDGSSDATYKLDTGSGVGVWTQLCGDLTTGCNVPTHQESVLAYIPDTDRAVLTSGLTSSDTSDTWELNPVTNTWSQICATRVCGSGNLPRTDAPGFVYFPDLHKAVLFGGTVPSGGGPCQTKSTDLCNNQTWLYDSTNKAAPNYGWTQVSTTHVPPSNKFPVMDYVPLLHKIVMVDYNPAGSHVWTFDGRDWTDLTAAGQIPAGPELAQFWTKNNIGAWDANANAFVVMSRPDTGSGTSWITPQIWKIVFAPATSAPFISFSPGSLTFDGQSVGSTSAPQTVTLTNTGTSSLTISSIMVDGANSGDFAQSNNCPISPSTLATSATCAIRVTFTPSSTAAENALVSVADNAIGSPHTINLNGGTQGGTGGGSVSFSPGSLNFSGQSVGSTSAPQTVTLRNTGTAPLSISGIIITGSNSSNFAQSNNCPIAPATLPAGANCAISVAFTPSTTGTQSAVLSIADNATGGSPSIGLSGSGDSASGGGAPPPATTKLPVGLTVQEAIYSGVSGVNRSQDPVTVGLPISDANAISDISQLGLNGASVGQFRVLGRWPSGNIQWVLVDTLADVPASGQNTSITLTTGAGSFGGSNLASDNGATIRINTGTATFSIRKANFDLVDQAVVNGRTLVAAGTSTGLAVLGPAPGGTLCPCSTTYSSSNDPSSQAVIEENGPVRTAIKASGRLMDSSGHTYMRYTVRMHFYTGRSYVKTVVLLQNADYGASNSFASAYKGFSAFEARLTPALGAGRSFSFGTAGTPVNGTFQGSESAYIYQGYSNKMEDCDWINPASGSRLYPYVARTLLTNSTCSSTWSYQQDGYKVVHGSTVLASGTRSQYPEGWADLTDSSGAGIEVGIYQMAAYWPKSLEFENGGGEVRVGIWPDQTLFMSGGQQYVQSWPQYSEHTLFLNFHSTPLTSASSQFTRYQYPLIARAPSGYYNATGVFMYPIPTAAEEDNYYKSLGVWCCINDYVSPHIYRTHGWGTAGGGNQAEMRWADLMLWLQRGYTARYLNTTHFYTMQVEDSFPRSDDNGTTPFNWRDSDMASVVDAQGFPSPIASLNNNVNCDAGTTSCNRNWVDTQHAHWYGMTDYYFLTGDETVRDAIKDGVSDTYGNPNVRFVVNGSYWAARDVGIALMSASRLNLFYKAIGDSNDAGNALQAGDTVLANQVYPDYQLSGYGTASQGTSHTRGMQVTQANSSTGSSGPFAKPFQQGILEEGMWEILKAHGPSWPQYNQTFDVAYGIAHWTLTEAWRTSGTAVGCTTNAGPAYQINLTISNNPLLPSCSQTVWFNFYNEGKYVGPNGDWTTKFNQYLVHLNGNGSSYAEYGLIFPAAVISEILHPQAPTLVTVPVTVANLGGGSYSLSWTVPPGATGYRIKYANKVIVDWIGFDPVHNVFIGNPATTWAWFASTDVSNPPVPAAAGTQQTFTVSGLNAAQNWHFAVKAYVH